ncbi:lipid IV(A) 3-deoxy-D-manno-octulosonic acid transferase [Vibrio sp.]|nr:lipid IV(A) 3-deoxy-D-manno-octulosonic acid transferase [Vibrio sp.]
MRFIYNLGLLLILPVACFLLLRKRKGKPHPGGSAKEYFGWATAIPPVGNKTKRKQKARDEKPIWIHAASVGEVIAIEPLVRHLRSSLPDTPVLVTTTTATGKEQVLKLRASDPHVHHRFMPLDLPWFIRLFIGRVQPRCLWLTEMEIWPNAIKIAHQFGLSTSIINARMSIKSFNKYQNHPFIFKLAAPYIDKVLAQTTLDSDHFKQLGIDDQRVSITGSIKFDLTINQEKCHQGHVLRKTLGSQRFVWVAASTHDGEDLPLLKAHQRVLDAHPDAVLIIVPRHPERFHSVYELALSQGFHTDKHSDTQKEPHLQKHSNPQPDCQVYIGDTLGDMFVYLSAADVCFMAGSLVGGKVGGHNPLEPAACQLPVINGPSYFNFTQIMEQLIDDGAVVIAESSDGIAHAVVELADNPSKRIEMGQAGLRVVEQNKGAVERTLNALIT